MSRGSGGKISKAIAWVKDTYHQHASGAEFSRDEWFALYPNDWNIDERIKYEGSFIVMFEEYKRNNG